MHEVWRISIATAPELRSESSPPALLARSARAVLAAAVVGLVAGAVLAWLIFDWKAAIGGGAGGALGGFGAGVFARGAVRRGATPGGLIVLLGGAALGVFALALIPFVGFLEALAIPAFALRARRRAGEKYAGLRTLAK